MGRSTEDRPLMRVDVAQTRRVRRAELLMQRQRAAERRRQRGFGLRLPSSKPLVFLDPPPAPPA
jgi:hypothetical protein